MPRTGRPRKPADRAQGHREHEPRAIVPVEVDAQPVAHVDVVPAPPLTAAGNQLLDEVLLLWDDFWSSPLVTALDGVAGVDRVVVNRWILTENEVEVLDRAIAEEGYYVTGSKGQVRANPLLNERHALKAEAERFWVQLGIGPRNRAQLGIDVAGATTAAMRLNEKLAATARGERAEEVDDDLSDWSRGELLEEAKELGIRGRTRMKRADLEAAIEEAWSA